MIYCDKCNHEFEIKLKKKKYGVSVEETFFKCPSCKERYSVIFTNPEARKMQRKVKGLKNELERNQLKRKIKGISENLKLKYSFK